jgi:hypothetical protein
MVKYKKFEIEIQKNERFFLRLEMTNITNKNILKGQYNPAQGKRRRSGALGLKTGKRIVRAMVIFMGQLLFRTKRMNSYLPENNESQFRPKEVFHINYCSSRTVFVVYS